MVGRGVDCELRCSAIHPEISQRGIEGLGPSSPGRSGFRGAAVAVAGVAAAVSRAFRDTAGSFLSVHLFEDLHAS
jgi:hypothetical protein